MNFDWSKYSTLAQEWKPSDKEELLRCSISRAYYAFYHSLRTFKGMSVGRQKHNNVKDKLKESEDPEEIKLAFHLGNLQESREYADYDSFKKVDANFVNSFFSRLEVAEELFRTLKL